MKTLHLSASTQTANSLKKLLRLEKCGRYEDAYREISEIWKDITFAPDVTDFPPEIAAELLVRCGSLLGFLGHVRQIADSQSKSRDILTDARSRFIFLGNAEKVAECENYLALSYWRTREFGEAKLWLEVSFAHNLPRSSRVRIYSHLIESMLLQAGSDHRGAVEYLRVLESNFRFYGDAFLNGSFCNNIGISYRESGNLAEALRYFELARFFHHKSRHKSYLGTVENNLAYLHKEEKRFGRAHAAIDGATEIFRKIKDTTREGFSLDTKAAIFLDEGKFDQALETVGKAIEILRKSENFGFLSETLMTRAKILLFSDDFAGAMLCFTEAADLTRRQSGETAALDLAREFQAFLQEKNSLAKAEPNVTTANEGNLPILMPIELARYDDVEAVKINNRHLEHVGLPQGSMAIVAKETIKRGDLAAICEKETGDVICGFCDFDFGIVSLQGAGEEPYLFDENKIEILGKIIGVGEPEQIFDGKMHVKPINLNA